MVRHSNFMPSKATKEKKQLVIDAGNGNVKASVLGETEVIPSVLSQNCGDYIRGGFKWGEDEHWVLGWDNTGRIDKLEVINRDNGKLEYLPHLLAGTISAMRHVIDPRDNIDVHVLTLNNDKRSLIETAVQKAAVDLSVDGEPLNLKLSLKNVYPEGYGASLHAAKVYDGSTRVAVLDIGNGTCNLSQYHVGRAGMPRREIFRPIPFGVSSIVKNTVELYRNETSNGSVNEGLIRQALTTNTYRYLSTYDGVDIRDVTKRAVEVWLDSPEVHQLMIQTVALLQQKVPVVLCGGGFAIDVVKDEVICRLAGNAPDETFLNVPTSPATLGVVVLAEVLHG